MQNSNYNQYNMYNRKREPYRFTALRIVSFIALFAAVFYANYFGSRSYAIGILQQFQINKTSFLIITSIFMAFFLAAIFEFIGRIVFNHVLRKTMFKAFTCQKEQFMDVLRWFHIIRCAILGSAFLLAQAVSFLLPLFNLLLNFVISVIVYYVFFIWLKKLNYLNKGVIHKTFFYLASLVVLFYGLIMIVEFFYWIV